MIMLMLMVYVQGVQDNQCLDRYHKYYYSTIHILLYAPLYRQMEGHCSVSKRLPRQ